MKNLYVKIILVFLIPFLFVSCVNNKVVKISDSLKRIDHYDSSGKFIKSYYKKFDKETLSWYSAKCKNTNYSNTRSYICEFTAVSLNEIHMVKYQKDSNDNINNSNDSQVSDDKESNDESSDDSGLELPALELPAFGIIIIEEECVGGPDEC